MDAIILAGGRGTRLRPLTDQLPKPLILVQGKPLLEWSLMTMRPVIDRVIVVASYLKTLIDAFMTAQHIFENYMVIEQLPKPLGTGHAVLCCRDALKSQSFLVINGDDLYPTGAIRALAQTKAGLLTVERNDQSRWGVVMLNKNGNVAKLHEKPPEGYYPTPVLINTGAYKFNQTIFDCPLKLSARDEYEITDYVSYLAQSETVTPVRTSTWITVGNPDDFHYVQTLDLPALLFSGQG